MSEPTSSAAAAIARTAGAITVTGSILGLEYQFLLVGMFGGLIALSFFPQETRWRMATSVVTSSLLAGYGTPVAAAIVMKVSRLFEDVPLLPLQLLLAFLLGLGTQILVPKWFGWLKSRKVDGNLPGGQS